MTAASRLLTSATMNSRVARCLSSTSHRRCVSMPYLRWANSSLLVNSQNNTQGEGEGGCEKGEQARKQATAAHTTKHKARAATGSVKTEIGATGINGHRHGPAPPSHVRDVTGECDSVVFVGRLTSASVLSLSNDSQVQAQHSNRCLSRSLSQTATEVAAAARQSHHHRGTRLPLVVRVLAGKRRSRERRARAWARSKSSARTGPRRDPGQPSAKTTCAAQHMHKQQKGKGKAKHTHSPREQPRHKHTRRHTRTHAQTHTDTQSGTHTTTTSVTNIHTRNVKNPTRQDSTRGEKTWRMHRQGRR
jgi:hypothetical protein